MLQQFLNDKLISVSNEEYFKKLKKCADELGKELAKDKSRLQCYALTAIDPKIPADNYLILEVNQRITKSWSTFASNIDDTPVTYIRAVMLEALKQATTDKIDNACLLWLSVQNVLQHLVISGKEKELLEQFFTQLANEIETHAQQKWSLLTDNASQAPDVKLTALKAKSIDSAKLEGHIKAASAHNGHGGENPNTTQNWSVWPDFFSKRTTQGIAEEVNKVTEALANDANKNQELIKNAVNTILNKAQKDIQEKNILLQIRTQLLWWKEANYSALFKTSYRKVQSPALEMALAADYAGYIPSPYPVSVDYFFKETHYALGKNDVIDTLKLSGLLTSIESAKETLKPFFTELALPNGRITLLLFINGLLHGKLSASQLNERVGLTGNEELRKADFALWLFHDTQAAKLIQTR